MPDRWSWPSGSGNFWALWPSPACGSLQRPLCVLPIEDPNQPSIQVGDHDGPHSPLVHPLDQGLERLIGTDRRGPDLHGLLGGRLGALLQRLAAQATLDDPPRQRRPRPDLIEQGLIDVYELWIDPLVLRTGKASSARGPKDRAEARGEQASSTGVATLTYLPGHA